MAETPQNTSRNNPPSRVKHYLLYAAGEILLVVVGILIAVQINNLNEQNKRLNNEVFILHEIAENLAQDGEHLRAILKQREETQRAIIRMSSYLDEPDGINEDTLAYDLAQLLTFERYFPIRTSYEVAKVGGLQISNKQLRGSIAAYYEYEQNIMQTSLRDIESAFLNQFPSIPSDNYVIEVYSERVSLTNHTDEAFLSAIRKVLSLFIPNHTGTISKLREFNTTNARMSESILEELAHRE